MIVKGIPYLNPEGYLFLDQKRKLGMVKRIQKKTLNLNQQQMIWELFQHDLQCFTKR